MYGSFFKIILIILILIKSQKYKLFNIYFLCLLFVCLYIFIVIIPPNYFNFNYTNIINIL